MVFPLLDHLITLVHDTLCSVSFFFFRPHICRFYCKQTVKQQRSIQFRPHIKDKGRRNASEPEAENKQTGVKNALCFRSQSKRCSTKSTLPVKICGLESEEESSLFQQQQNDLIANVARCNVILLNGETDGTRQRNKLNLNLLCLSKKGELKALKANDIRP